jgi:hypothetical protein
MILVEETDERFYLAESTMPNAGLGVFSKVFLEKGDHLEIIGVMVKKDSLSDKCTHYGDRYKFAANGKIIKGKYHTDFSAKVLPVGYGGMVNHATTPEQQNAEIFYHNGPKKNAAAGKVIYRFIRDIVPDEEILGNYGQEWTGIMDWAEKKANEIDRFEDDWETFLSYDLYNLGQLRQ